MRVSRLLIVTLRDAPADAEIISHKLLLRGGYIRRVSSGIYAYLPLMWRVIEKVKEIVREEMNSTGALETLLPQLQPAELWKKSGRWEGYTEGEGIMFNLKDRQGRENGLGPTHEEVITSIAGELLNSYRQLPINLYQIQTKFRDEIRPRFGLMRSREFIMKDSYSFHADQANLGLTYEQMEVAYKKIFLRCGLNTVAVDADSGAIGGGSSVEFMAIADSGEDLILVSQDEKYSANQEKAVSIPQEAKKISTNETKIIETIDQKTISRFCEKNNFHPSQLIKVILMLGISEEKKEYPLLISIRGDQELNEVKLTNHIINNLKINIIKLESITPERIREQKIESIPFGYLGPDLKDNILSKAKSWERSFLRINDNTIAELNSFACGANELERHKICRNLSEINIKQDFVDIRKAKAGDRSIQDPEQFLSERRGIEIGHIFKLGQKYSKALQATFTSKEGSSEEFWMGCYGIGVSRLAQAAVEQNHDKDGIIWPVSIAPFEVIIVIANYKDEIQAKLGESIYSQLLREKIDCIIDDREERAGLKFKDADLIGIPWRIVIGRDASNGLVELVNRRTLDAQSIESNKIPIILKKLISEGKRIRF